MSVFNKNKRIQYLGFNDFGFSIVGILVISFVTNYLFNDPLEQITLDLKLIAWAGSLFFTCIDWFAIRVVIIFLRKKYLDFKKELKFAKAYIHIQSERFGDNLQMNWDIPEQKLQKMIVPMSLQLLLENAIKHNVVSKSKPLLVRVEIKEDHLVVINKIQAKSTQTSSTKT